MELTNILSGALLMATLLLIGSAVTHVVVSTERALRTAPGRAAARRLAKLTTALALVVGLWVGFGRLSFEIAFDARRAFVPQDTVRWQPAGDAPASSFDRFEFGSVSNAEIARRS